MFKSVPRKAKKERREEIPPAVAEQRLKCSKYNYKYEVLPGTTSIVNNTTLYVKSDIAHPHQIKECFAAAIEQARKIYGRDFTSTIDVNLVKSRGTTYLGYAYVNLSNPSLYYLLIGMNPDGTSQSVDDTLTPSEKEHLLKFKSWADYMDEYEKITEGKIKPKISLPPFKYDEEQLKHKSSGEKEGMLVLERAHIVTGEDKKIDERKLFVTGVPAFDLNFLYTIFAPYAVTPYPMHLGVFYPKIEIKKDRQDAYYANVEYYHSYDAAFASLMLRKVSVKYKNEIITLKSSRAFKKNYMK